MPQQMDRARLEEYCALGEKADTELRRGRVQDALKIYSEIMRKLEQHHDNDSYLMAKVTLGTLRCYVKLGDFKTAFTVWNTSVEEGAHGIGIYALESAQTTIQDMVAYDMLCGFLHTLADSQPVEAASAVNQYLSRVCEHAIENGERHTLQMALSNWKQHLRDVFKGTIPHEFAVPLIHFEKLLGEAVKPNPIDFPLPTPWEKPRDFREMSRVLQLREATRAGQSSARKRKAI